MLLVARPGNCVSVMSFNLCVVVPSPFLSMDASSVQFVIIWQLLVLRLQMMIRFTGFFVVLALHMPIFPPASLIRYLCLFLLTSFARSRVMLFFRLLLRNPCLLRLLPSMLVTSLVLPVLGISLHPTRILVATILVVVPVMEIVAIVTVVTMVVLVAVVPLFLAVRFVVRKVTLLISVRFAGIVLLSLHTWYNLLLPVVPWTVLTVLIGIWIQVPPLI